MDVAAELRKSIGRICDVPAEAITDESTLEAAQKEVKEVREHGEKMANLEKDAFLADANRELDRIDKNIESLKNRAGTMTGEAKKNVNAEIEVLENKYDILKRDIDDAKVKSGDDLVRLKNSFEASLREIERSYNEIAAKAG